MVVTIRIAIVLCVWSVYAQSGTGVIRVLPFLKPGFVGIMATYIARAIVFAPAVLTTGGSLRRLCSGVQPSVSGSGSSTSTGWLSVDRLLSCR